MTLQRIVYPSKIDEMTRRKLVREVVKEVAKTAAGISGSSSGCVGHKSHILHMSGLWSRMARWKPFSAKKKHPNLAKCLQKHISLPL